MPKVSPCLPLLMLALATAGCDRADSRGGPGDAVPDGREVPPPSEIESGAPPEDLVVPTPADPPSQSPEEAAIAAEARPAAAFPWTVVEEWRIGGAAASPEAAFGAQPLLLALAPAGRIVVLDGQTQEVRAFDGAGGFLRRFGTRGPGPGEFDRARAMGWGADDDLWVRDLRRYTVLDSLGTVLETIPREATGRGLGVGPVVFDPSGAILEWVRLERSAFTSGEVDGQAMVAVEAYTGTFDLGLFRMDRAGQSVESLPPVEGPDFALRETEVVPANLPRLAVARVSAPGLADLSPFIPRLVFSLTPDGVWFAASNSDRIILRSPAGDTLRVVELAREPFDLTREEDEGISGALSAAGRDRSQFAYGRQLIQGIYPLEDGHLLVLIEEHAGEDSDLFDVFDPDGLYLGPVRFGFRVDATSQMIIRGDTVIAVSKDELEAKYLVRATLRR